MVAEIPGLRAEIDALQSVTDIGRINAVEGNLLRVTGLTRLARVGDRIRMYPSAAPRFYGEIVQIHPENVSVLPDKSPEGLRVGDRAELRPMTGIAPSDAWLGRVITPDGEPLDGAPLLRGPTARALRERPSPAAKRRALGGRLETGMAVFNTMLPLARGQRIGLFAGSGVGKSTLLAQLARGLAADVVVVAMIGERGREVREFTESVLGPQGMARSVVVAATSDQPAVVRRRCAWSAMAIAEHFRSEGKQVLYLADSITRFAEAHREIAVASGELPALGGYPASTAHTIMSLCERAGPGMDEQGDITAVFSVLVAGGDMEGPIADILRGVLDGHVVLDRKIAERGRFPAVNLLQSVSRSLPGVASEQENCTIAAVRKLLGDYEQSEMMIRTGLYKEGSDIATDLAVKAREDLERMWSDVSATSASASFDQLGLILRRLGIDRN